jgi:hypothetical protein
VKIVAVGIEIVENLTDRLLDNKLNAFINSIIARRMQLPSRVRLCKFIIEYFISGRKKC